MTVVDTEYGPGQIVASSTTPRGRREYRVAGEGFDVWIDETKLPLHTGASGVTSERPQRARHGWAPVDFDHSVDLPYDPTPQYPAIPGDTESTIQPIHEIDSEERLSPADSITFEDRSRDESDRRGEPGPNPDLFAKGAARFYADYDDGEFGGTEGVDDQPYSGGDDGGYSEAEPGDDADFLLQNNPGWEQKTLGDLLDEAEQLATEHPDWIDAPLGQLVQMEEAAEPQGDYGQEQQPDDGGDFGQEQAGPPQDDFGGEEADSAPDEETDEISPDNEENPFDQGGSDEESDSETDSEPAGEDTSEEDSDADEGDDEDDSDDEDEDDDDVPLECEEYLEKESGWQHSPEMGDYGGEGPHSNRLEPDPHEQHQQWLDENPYAFEDESPYHSAVHPPNLDEFGDQLGGALGMIGVPRNWPHASREAQWQALIPLVEGLGGEAGAGAAAGEGAAGGEAAGGGGGGMMSKIPGMGGGGGGKGGGDGKLIDEDKPLPLPDLGYGWGSLAAPKQGSHTGGWRDRVKEKLDEYGTRPELGPALPAHEWMAQNPPEAAMHDMLRPAGLSDKYIDITADADYHNSPVLQFRHDPDAYISRHGHVQDEGLNPRFAEYVELVEADHNIREAAWKDVRAKAMRLRREGHVQVKDIDYDRIYATVQGDHGVYDTMIKKGGSFGGIGGGHAISNWHCSCEWGKWAFRRRYTYIGRLCSHGYAAYLEMQSSHVKGKKRLERQVRPPKRRKRADALQMTPQRLTPELIVNDTPDDALEFKTDVTKDDRKTTGPGQIVHFSNLMKMCDRNLLPYPRELIAFLERTAAPETQDQRGGLGGYLERHVPEVLVNPALGMGSAINDLTEHGGGGERGGNGTPATGHTSPKPAPTTPGLNVGTGPGSGGIHTYPQPQGQPQPGAPAGAVDPNANRNSGGNTGTGAVPGPLQNAGGWERHFPGESMTGPGATPKGMPAAAPNIHDNPAQHMNAPAGAGGAGGAPAGGKSSGPAPGGGGGPAAVDGKVTNDIVSPIGPGAGTYTVKPGDTLNDIAKGNNTTVENLVNNNQGAMGSGTNLTQNKNMIHPGDTFNLGTQPGGAQAQHMGDSPGSPPAVPDATKAVGAPSPSNAAGFGERQPAGSPPAGPAAPPAAAAAAAPPPPAAPGTPPAANKLTGKRRRQAAPVDPDDASAAPAPSSAAPKAAPGSTPKATPGTPKGVAPPAAGTPTSKTPKKAPGAKGDDSDEEGQPATPGTTPVTKPQQGLSTGLGMGGGLGGGMGGLGGGLGGALSGIGQVAAPLMGEVGQAVGPAVSGLASGLSSGIGNALSGLTHIFGERIAADPFGGRASMGEHHPFQGSGWPGDLEIHDSKSNVEDNYSDNLEDVTDLGGYDLGDLDSLENLRISMLIQADDIGGGVNTSSGGGGLAPGAGTGTGAPMIGQVDMNAGGLTPSGGGMTPPAGGAGGLPNPASPAAPASPMPTARRYYAEDQGPEDWKVNDYAEARPELNRLRNWAEDSQEQYYGDMADHVDDVQQTVDDAIDKGVAASPLVASYDPAYGRLEEYQQRVAQSQAASAAYGMQPPSPQQFVGERFEPNDVGSGAGGGIKRAGKPRSRPAVVPEVVRVVGPQRNAAQQQAAHLPDLPDPYARKLADFNDHDEPAPMQQQAMAEDPVAAFQRSAAAQELLAANGGGGGGEDFDIAGNASQFLQRTAGRNFSLAEQHALMNERHPLGARNLDSLDLSNTHYEAENSVGLF